LYNCNSESELKVFPFISFEDAVKEATKNIGNTLTERSWGMYSTPDEKPKWKQEPPKEQKTHLQTLESLANNKNQTMASSTITPPVQAQKIENKQNECISNGEITVINSDSKPEIKPVEFTSMPNPIQWNPYNKVVQDHRNGTINIPATNAERSKRGLIIPWTPDLGQKEVNEPPVE
jgi:hypothetical protein